MPRSTRYPVRASWVGALQLRLTPSWSTTPTPRAPGAWGGSLLTRCISVSDQGPLQPSDVPGLYRERIRTLYVSPPVRPLRVSDVSAPSGYELPRWVSSEASQER